MKSLMRLRVRHLFLGCALGALLLPAALLAQAPGKHPAYLHALADLRWARGYLEMGTDSYSAQAVREIDDAIGDIKKASFDDGKSLNAHPPIDTQIVKNNRLRKAMELLNKAHSDVDQEEDNPEARGLKTKVLGHIDAAHGFVDQAMQAGLK